MERESLIVKMLELMLSSIHINEFFIAKISILLILSIDNLLNIIVIDVYLTASEESTVNGQQRGRYQESERHKPIIEGD